MGFLNYLANNPVWFLIALGIFVFLVGVVCIVSRQTISDAALLYCGVLFLIVFAIYSTGSAYTNQDYTWKSCFECLYAAMKAFGFEVKFSYLDALMAVSPIYSIAVFVSVFFAGVTLVIGLIEFATAALLNNIFVMFKMIGKKRDIVLGYGDDAFNYCKNNKNTILWVDSTVTKMTREDRKRLFRDGILFIYKPFNTKYLKHSTLCVFETIFVICFQNENDYLQIVFNTLEGFKKENKEYKFHVQTSNEHIDFINGQLTKRCLGKGKVMAMTFEYHDLISHNFSVEYNLVDAFFCA